MPINSETLNKQLYKRLSKYKPKPLDAKGNVTPVEDEADVFKFIFSKEGEDYGTVFATIDDNHALTVYYSDDVTESPAGSTPDIGYDDSWTGLLKQLKSWAMHNQLSWKLKDRSHLEGDMARRDHMNKKDKIAEGYYSMGRNKSYSDNIPSVKIVIEHTRQIEEGEQRYRNINKIFLENQMGERFLLDTKKPGIARVYARHIAEGGKVNDDRWGHIQGLCEEYQKMAGFVRATRNNQFNESAQKLVNEAITHYQGLRESLSKMTGKRGYEAYFESWTPPLMEDETDTSNLNELFVQETLDPRIESVMPILSRLQKRVAEMKEVSELAEWADSLIEGEGGPEASEEPVDADMGNDTFGDDDGEDAPEDDLGEGEDGTPQSHQAQTTLKHLKKASYGDRADAANIKSGIAGFRDRIDMLKRAKDEGNLVDEEESLTSNNAIGIPEGEEHSPVAGAITRRILSQRSDLLKKYGPVAIMQAIDDVADFVGDVDEIGSSDVSGWIRQVEQSLGGSDSMQNEGEDGTPQSHQAQTTLKHFKKAGYGDRADAANIKPGIAGYRDRIDMLQRAEKEGNLKEEDMEEGIVDTLKKVGKKVADYIAPDDEQLLKDLQKRMGIPKHAQHGKPSMARSDIEKRVDEEEVEESALQAYLGDKKYGKDGMDALRKAGQEHASEKKMQNIRAKFSNKEKEVDEGLDADQKRVGQLGPTEKVGKKGAVGKLVGANENFIGMAPQAVAEGEGNFAKAIGNLHGWHQDDSSDPNIERYEFDDREGGYYAYGTIEHNIKTGEIAVDFEDKSGEYDGDIKATFNSIGDAMDALRRITIQHRYNTGKAQSFDRLGNRTLAGPDDVYKTDRAGKKGTLTKSRMDTMKQSTPYRKTGPIGVLPEGQDDLNAIKRLLGK
jgi:hypothetical protein